MVNTTIPQFCTGSPSSFPGVPHLTINKDTTTDLDSSNAFEGPEKLLEVWFSRSVDGLPPSVRPPGLKAVSADIWKEMLDLVNCKVLSVIESDQVDAYLLSESSMFVFPHKLVLKTCGTTTLLLGLPRILEIAAIEAGFPASSTAEKNASPPYRVFYSRKNFHFSDQQRGPHRSWRDEVRYLDKLFLGGSAYMMGKMNGEHWYLYITAPDTQLTPPTTPEMEQVATQMLAIPDSPDPSNKEMVEASDETLEILMTDLDEENARQFYLEEASKMAKGDRLGRMQEAGSLTFAEELTTEGHTLGTVVSDACGLADIYPKSKYPDARVDAYLFTPCGFSANGVVPSPQDPGAAHYFTVHVTPEPVCSYASFETSVPSRKTGRETVEVVTQVVKIFKPGRFSVTLFEAKSKEDGPARVCEDKDMDVIPGYRRVDRVVHDLEGYELVFRHFERDGLKGGAPRLGGSPIF